MPGWERLLTHPDAWHRRLLAAVLLDATNARTETRRAELAQLRNTIALAITDAF